MKRSLVRRLIDADFQNLLDALTTRQHLHPHERLADTLAATVECVGVCPKAVDDAVRWLAVDADTRIGRLRRTELTQLAQSIHRFWRQREPAESAEAAEATPAPRP
jgi:hypothetical protein